MKVALPLTAQAANTAYSAYTANQWQSCDEDVRCEKSSM